MAESEVPTSASGYRPGKGKGPMASFMTVAKNAAGIVMGSGSTKARKFGHSTGLANNSRAGKRKRRSKCTILLGTREYLSREVYRILTSIDNIVDT